MRFGKYPLWLSAMTLIRSSIIFLYIRIFPMRWFRNTCYSILIFNIVVFVTMIPINLVATFSDQCDFPCASSYNSEEWTLVLALGFNLLLDVVVVALPVPSLWRLQIPISKKIMLSGMFGLGIM